MGWQKVFFATYGVVLSAIIVWAAWVTSCIYTFDAWKNLGPRFTTSDASLMRSNIMEDVRRETLAETSRTRLEIQEIRKDLQELIVVIKLHIAEQSRAVKP